METTATFDAATDEFIIHTPTPLAQKYWITNSAIHAHVRSPPTTAPDLLPGCLGHMATVAGREGGRVAWEPAGACRSRGWVRAGIVPVGCVPG